MKNKNIKKMKTYYYFSLQPLKTFTQNLEVKKGQLFYKNSTMEAVFPTQDFVTSVFETTGSV